jgi:hypothetical protein
MSTTRVTLSAPASKAIRALIDKILEDGLKSMPPEFREMLDRLESRSASDPSNVAIALMVAGAERYGIDLAALGEIKIAPERLAVEGEADRVSRDET